jgi:hypothetical protein
MQVQTINNRSTPLLVSKNILIRDSIFKRLDLQNEYSSEDKAKDSQMYQQLELKLETAKRDHMTFLQAIDEVINTQLRRLKWSNSRSKGKRLPSMRRK